MMRRFLSRSEATRGTVRIHGESWTRQGGGARPYTGGSSIIAQVVTSCPACKRCALVIARRGRYKKGSHRQEDNSKWYKLTRMAYAYADQDSRYVPRPPLLMLSQDCNLTHSPLAFRIPKGSAAYGRRIDQLHKTRDESRPAARAMCKIAMDTRKNVW
ncbi:hypothetical protein L226DRAFT_387922 [Lentinus tigrinus ALCF2SS1-7]|uniref:uncharacterized protein n=1 Tax=Lentinus tigrinus ALCF2SS1-7 TaxID=1328758 RepID=UPI001166317F|nr:hypothetical protein L226DRAFT_387922 [Lentinus tigrinus ALCF2SS1-7]